MTLDLEIVRSGPVPLYRQISDWMTQQIVDEVWPSHYKLPAEPELADMLGVSRGTLRKAINELLDQGLLVSTQGVGTFVAARTLELPLSEHLVTFSEDLISRGIPFETRVLRQTIVAADARLAARLDTTVGEALFFVMRVRLIEERPAILLHNYVRYAYVPGIEDGDFVEKRLFELLEERYGLQISWARRKFAARAASEEIAAHLELEPGAPVMFVEQYAHLVDDSPVEYSELWIGSEEFHMTATVTRENFRQGVL